MPSGECSSFGISDLGSPNNRGYDCRAAPASRASAWKALEEHIFSQLPHRDLHNALESEQSIHMAVFTSTHHQDYKSTLSSTFRVWSIKQSPSGWRILRLPVYTARHHLICTGSQHCKMWSGRGRLEGYPTAICSRAGLGFLPPRWLSFQLWGLQWQMQQF